MFGEKVHQIYKPYKNTWMPHCRHIYAKTSDMAKATVCTYTQSDHALPHCKCVLRCCADFPCINLTEQETYKNMKKKHPQLGFRFIT